MAIGVGKRPTGFLRLFFRFPILLYEIGLSWLFGNRFLMLTHLGRNSGQLHHTVLEVLYHDRNNGRYYVLSGWGVNSNWYNNISKNPEVIVNVNGHNFEALAVKVSIENAAELIIDYCRKHPKAMQILSKRILGIEVSCKKEDIEMLSKSLPVIRLQPL